MIVVFPGVRVLLVLICEIRNACLFAVPCPIREVFLASPL